MGVTEDTPKMTPKEAAKRKKAVQKYYNERNKKFEAAGSTRKGTSSAVNPEVLGADPQPEFESTIHKARRPTEELMKEQGIEVKQLDPKTAPESDAVSEEWEKRTKHAETAKTEARTPLAQAKMNAEALGLQIAETETRSGTIGEKIKEAAAPKPRLSDLTGVDVKADTLTADVAKGNFDRIIQSTLNKEGEFETKIITGDDKDLLVEQARDAERRGGVDRRAGSATRRGIEQARSTQADADILLTGSEREGQAAKQKSARRLKKAGGDRRGATPEATPSILDRPERRGPSLVDSMDAEAVGELKDYAVRGDPIAKETLKQYRAELKGIGLERRAADTVPRELARLELDIERAERGTPESRSVWDPKAEHPVPRPQMDVNADLMPKVDVYSGDPVVANTAARMDKRIADLTKRAMNSPPAVAQTIENTLVKLRRQREGLPPVANRVPNTRQFPTAESEKIEGARKPGETRIPDVERRAHMRDPATSALRRDTQKVESRRTTGAERRGLESEFVVKTPVERRAAGATIASGEARDAPAQAPRPSLQDPRRAQRRGEGRQRATHEQRTGAVTRPAPDLSVGERVEYQRPASWTAENPNMWADSLKRAGHTPAPLTGPAIGANVGSNIWESAKKGVKRGFKPKNIVRGASGLAAVTALFASPEIASAYVDASGDQKDRIDAAGGQALESGFAIGTGMALFTGGLMAAKKAVPGAIAKGVVGAAGHAAGSAIVGWTAGTAAGNIYSRVKRVSEKKARDTAYAKEKYGTVEAATRTRKGLKADGTPMTLDDTEEIARRWEREAAKLKRSK